MPETTTKAIYKASLIAGAICMPYLFLSPWESHVMPDYCWIMMTSWLHKRRFDQEAMKNIVPIDNPDS